MAPRLTRTAFEYSLSPVSQGEDSPNTFPAAPADEHAPSQLGGQVDGVGDLADGEAPDVAVVVGESAVAEHGVREEVRRHHRHAETGGVDRRPKDAHVPPAICPRCREGEEVVVVEAHPRRRAQQARPPLGPDPGVGAPRCRRRQHPANRRSRAGTRTRRHVGAGTASWNRTSCRHGPPARR
jgi:hypothetical protein